jgi:L-threonylcarbamoyladenylate synthase
MPTVDRVIRASGVPSTVIRWTGEDWEILRQGAVEVEGNKVKGKR